MTNTRFKDMRDYGGLRIKRQDFSNYTLAACGLSLGTKTRSVFEECRFSKIKGKRNFIGFPVFIRCQFDDICAEPDGLLSYGAAFSECVFTGKLQHVVIGFMAEQATAENCATALQAENLEFAEQAEFAVDFSRAELEDVVIRGEAIVPFVRFARDQALVLRSINLFEKLVDLGRASPNRSMSSFFLGTGALPGCSCCVATIERETLPYLELIEEQLKTKQIDFVHF